MDINKAITVLETGRRLHGLFQKLLVLAFSNFNPNGTSKTPMSDQLIRLFLHLNTIHHLDDIGDPTAKIITDIVKDLSCSEIWDRETISEIKRMMEEIEHDFHGKDKLNLQILFADLCDEHEEYAIKVLSKGSVDYVAINGMQRNYN